MRRLFIVDPVCVQRLGHNLPAMSYFIRHARKLGTFDAVEGYCGKALEGTLDDPAIHPRFSFCYGHLIRLPDGGGRPDPIAEALSNKDYEDRSVREFAAFLSETGCGPEDMIFMPSADYFGMLGLLQALEPLGPERAPRTVLRMISVLDFTSRGDSDARGTVIGLIRRLREAGHDIEVVAETPAYAGSLAASLDTLVHVAPYPVIDDFVPSPDDAAPLVSVLGSGRYDKGFLRLLPIFRQVIERAQDLSVRFVVQNLPNHNALPYMTYISQLSALPGMMLLGETIPSHTLSRYMHLSTVTVAPYAEDVYRLRGSAMLMEALSIGRPIIASAGCGFSSQIAYYDCGDLARDDEEFVEHILNVVARTPQEANRRMRQARARFVLDSDAAYRRIFR